MKQFQFGLQSVLSYKNRVLEQIVVEHGEILAEILKVQNEIKSLDLEYKSIGSEFLKKQLVGISSEQAYRYRMFLDSLNYQIDVKKEEIKKLTKIERKHQDKLILAKQDASTLEKLKEQKCEEHKKEQSKQEEMKIEEFLVRQLSFFR